MIAMWSRSFHRFARLSAVLSLGLGVVLSAQNSSHRGRKYKAPPPVSRIEVTVLRSDDAKPIRNAAVVFTLVSEKGNMELKTNEDGKAVIDVLPTGSKATMQVLARGYQTYGKDFEIDKPEMAFEVKLNRPGKQYSIYENHPEAAKQDGGAGKGEPSNNEKDGAAKGSDKKDQPAESATDSGAKPEANQPQPQ